MTPHDDAARQEVTELARPLRDAGDLDPMIERIGGAHSVLLGEASHGTADYCRWRSDITRRLIAEHGFSFVAVEGDRPGCFRVNRWVKNRDKAGPSPRQLLDGFGRWPTWMWANEEVAEFIGWLRDHNRATGAGAWGSTGSTCTRSGSRCVSWSTTPPATTGTRSTLRTCATPAW